MDEISSVLSVENQRLKNTVYDLREQLDSQYREARVDKERSEQSLRECKELAEKHAHKCESMRKQLEGKLEDCQRSDRLITQLRDQLSQAREEADHLADLRGVKTKLGNMEASLEQQKSVSSELSRELSESRNSLRNERRKSNEYRRMSEQLRQEKTDLHSQSVRLSKEVSQIKNENQHMKAELDHFHLRESTMNSESEGIQRKNRELESRIQLLKQDNLRLSDTVDELSKSVDTLSILRSQVESLTLEIVDRNAQIQGLEEQLRMERSNNDHQSVGPHALALQTSLKNTQNEMDQLQTQYQSTQKRLVDKSERLMTLQLEFEQQKHQNSELIKIQTDLKSNLEARCLEKAQLKSQLALVQRERMEEDARHKADLNALKSRVSELESMETNWSRAHKLRDEEQRRTNQESAVLKVENRTLTQRLAQLPLIRKELQRLKNAYSKLKHQSVVREHDECAAAQDLRVSREEIESLRKEIQELHSAKQASDHKADHISRMMRIVQNERDTARIDAEKEREQRIADEKPRSLSITMAQRISENQMRLSVVSSTSVFCFRMAQHFRKSIEMAIIDLRKQSEESELHFHQSTELLSSKCSQFIRHIWDRETESRLRKSKQFNLIQKSEADKSLIDSLKRQIKDLNRSLSEARPDQSSVNPMRSGQRHSDHPQINAQKLIIDDLKNELSQTQSALRKAESDCEDYRQSSVHNSHHSYRLNDRAKQRLLSVFARLDHAFAHLDREMNEKTIDCAKSIGRMRYAITMVEDKLSHQWHLQKREHRREAMKVKRIEQGICHILQVFHVRFSESCVHLTRNIESTLDNHNRRLKKISRRISSVVNPRVQHGSNSKLFSQAYKLNQDLQKLSHYVKNMCSDSNSEKSPIVSNQSNQIRFLASVLTKDTNDLTHELERFLRLDNGIPE